MAATQQLSLETSVSDFSLLKRNERVTFKTQLTENYDCENLLKAVGVCVKVV